MVPPQSNNIISQHCDAEIHLMLLTTHTPPCECTETCMLQTCSGAASEERQGMTASCRWPRIT